MRDFRIEKLQLTTLNLFTRSFLLAAFRGFNVRDEILFVVLRLF